MTRPPAPPGHVPRVRRLAVVRANALGDFVLALPALAALRVAYPDARITLLGRPWHATFLAGRPSPVDDVLVVPPTPGVSTPPDGEDDVAGREDMLRVLTRSGPLDLALQLHGGGGYSNPFTQSLGARITAGTQALDAPPLDRNVRYVLEQHEVLRWLEVVALVGALPVGIEPRIMLVPRDAEELAASSLPFDRAYAVLHPGASDPRRRWPASAFALVGDALARHDLDVVVVGDDADRDLAAEVVMRMRSPARSLAGHLSLGALAALLASSAVVIGNDSGPLHLAGAVGAATVGIYWCGNVITAGPLTMQRHRVAISWRVTCPVCGVDVTMPRCGHDASFVADVPVETVVREALDLLASGPG